MIGWQRFVTGTLLVGVTLLGQPRPAGAGLALVQDISPGMPSGFPSNMVNLAGVLLFAANDATNGSELWKSDGTTAGTVLLKDIDPTGSGAPGGLVNVNGTVYFAADDGVNGRELWKSDGTSAGTVLVSNIRPGAMDSSPSAFTPFGGLVYFVADDGTNGRELWRTNGTGGGTAMVRDINAAAGSNPSGLTPLGSRLYFAANDGTSGAELWATDGTNPGTVMVRDINPMAGSGPGGLSAMNGLLYFVASDGPNGTELWQSDGTPGGTVMVRDINPSGTAFPFALLAVGSTLYFGANDGSHGFELWKSDGTAAGTVMVADLNPGMSGSLSQQTMTTRGGRLFFLADDGLHGNEPWTSDGTAAGTTLVKDINLGPASSSASQTLVAFGGLVAFAANDGVHGGELWVSDGTEAGTVLVGEANPSGDGIVQSLTFSGGTLFMNGYEPSVGQELFAATFPPAVTGALEASGPIGSPFTYTVTATGLEPRTFAATGLPPGLTLAGDMIAGTPTEIGVFPVALAVETPGGSAEATLTLTIEALPNPGPSNSTLDSDGDGFADEIESAVGTSPGSSTSTPFDGAPAGAAQPLAGTKLKVNLDFARAARDAIVLRATLPIPEGFDPAGAALVVDVGGVVQSVERRRIRLKRRAGVVRAQAAKVALTVKRASLAALLADEGLSNADVTKAPRTVPIIVLLERALLRTDQAQTYSAKAGKRGRSR